LLDGDSVPKPLGFTAFAPEWQLGSRSGSRRSEPFRPLSRRSGRIPALPYPPLRSFQPISSMPDPFCMYYGGEFKKAYLNVGAPWAVCISPGPHQYLFSSNSNGTSDMENGEIYKMELDGRILGKFGTAGKLLKEFGSVHEIDCRNPNEILVGEITNWRVQKLTLHASASGTR